MFKTIASAALLAAPSLAAAQAIPPLNTVPAAVQSGTYSVEPTQTRVLFSVSHLGFTTWYGEFTHAAGTLF
jgi:polyisoprenoid-binding protein YceI